MSIIKGGAAGFKSVAFYSENFSSKAIRNKDGTIIIDISKRKIASKFEELVSVVPFLRGLYLFARPIIVMWKIYLMVFLPLFIFLISVSYDSEKNSEGSSFLPVSIIVEWIQNHSLFLIAIILVIFTIVIKLSNLGKYHGAEHMTDTSYNRFSSLALTDVVKQSRIHKRCGTHLAVFILITYFISSFFISDIFILIILSFCLGFEIFLIQSKFMTPFYWVGGLLQYLFFTSKPSIEHLEVAIASYKALLEAEKNYNMS